MNKNLVLCLGIVTFSSKKNEQIREFMPLNDQRLVYKFLMGDSTTTLYRDELNVPNSSDGHFNSKDCSCILKMVWWIRFAIKTWPHSLYYGKTEDDTYINFPKLFIDLTYLDNFEKVMYGLMNLVNNQEFVGDFESNMHTHKKHGLESFPFPTGPLAIFSNSLSKDLFEDSCTFINILKKTYGKHCHVSKTNILGKHSCDGIIGLLLGNCTNQTVWIGSMTWTKNHHNAKTAGGMGWVKPGPESIVVHYLKGYDKSLREVAHNQSSRMDKPLFRPIMYSYEAKQNKTTLIDVHMKKKYDHVCSRPHGQPPEPGGNNRTWHTFGCHFARGYNIIPNLLNTTTIRDRIQ